MMIFEYTEPGKDDPTSLVDMIDRSYSHFAVTAAFGKNVFQGTVFDGELVKSKNGYEYQIFDCIAFGGKYVGNETHLMRMEYARNCIKEKYKYDERNHTFKIVVKEYVNLNEAIESLHDREQEDYPIDGWILIDVQKPYICGKDINLFKYKKPEHHTLDFKLCEFDNVLSLCVIENGSMRKIQTPANIPRDSLDALEVYSEKMLLGRILECKWEEKSRMWVPIMVRFDKDIPNNTTNSYNLTLKNLQEKITTVEMFRLLSRGTISQKELLLKGSLTTNQTPAPPPKKRRPSQKKD